MAPHTYGEILARNIRAARSRIDIGQDSVAARMRALGFQAWIRQTVSSTERGRRRPTAEEILALSLVLNTSVVALMTPEPADVDVTFPSGAALDWLVGRAAVQNRGGIGVRWDDDKPVFPERPQSIRVPESWRDTAAEMDEWMARAEAAVGRWPGGRDREDG